MFRTKRDSDASSDFDRLAFDREGRFERRADLLRDSQCVPFVTDYGKENREFVAAEARNGVAGANQLFDAVCGLPEEQVSDMMSECVVDVFEPVEIDEQERCARTRAE
jgi:hypothetical protein